MSEPGKYVLLKKVQPSSKQIKKNQKRKEKKLKQKLGKVQPKKTAPQPAKQKSTNPQLSNEVTSKKKKSKQKPSKKNNQVKINVPPKKNRPEKTAHAVVKNKKQNPKSDSSTEPKMSFGDDLTDRLKASRFRFINEQLYTQTGDQAIDVFEQDDSAFTTYHDGYRKQIEQWPINPLDRLINSIKKLYE